LAIPTDCGKTPGHTGSPTLQVALLSTLEPSTDDPSTPRGLLRVGGRSVVAHQLGTALALGCERVVCLAEGLPGELIAVQHAAEAAGATFQVATDSRALARLIKTEDELLVIADGLVANPEAIAALLGPHTGPRFAIVVQPVEGGLAAGYERLDLNHAAGGVMRLPGKLAAGLAELPGDWNPAAALLRIAAQAGLRQVVLPGALADDGRWTLVRNDAEAHRLEPRWLRLHTAGASDGGPGAWLSARLVERLGPALLHAGTRPWVMAAGAAVLAAFGLGLAWAGLAGVGFVLLGLGWLVRRAAALLARIDREAISEPPNWLRTEALFGWLFDLCLALVAAWRFAEDAPGAAMNPTTMWAGWFAALAFVGLLRLIPRAFARRRWAAWFDDRLLASLALAAASFSSVFDLALMAGGLVLLAVALAATYDGSDEPGDESGPAPAPPSG